MPKWRPPWLALPVVAALMVGMVAFVLTQDNTVAPGASPQDLAAPDEPPQAVAPTPVSAIPVPDLAVGWRTVDLVGGGWSLSGIDHGPSGWLAVADGVPFVVHTSENASLWEARTLPEMSGSDPQAAVGDGIMAVVASTPAMEWVGARSGAVSRDGGTTWFLAALDDRFTSIVDTTIIGSDVYAFGSAGEMEGTSELMAGTAVVWRLEGERWVALDAGGTAPSFVTAVVAGPGGDVRAFGSSGRVPTSWVVGETALERVQLDLPPDSVAISFLDVEVDSSDGFVALANSVFQGFGDTVWRSDDLVSWQVLHDGRQVTDLTVAGPTTLIGTTGTADQFWQLEDGAEISVQNGYPDVVTGWEAIENVGEIEVGGGLIVMVGWDEMGVARMAVRGVRPFNPVSLPAWTNPAELRWRQVAAVDDAGLGEPFLIPTVVSQDGSFVAGSNQIWRVDEVEGNEPLLARALPGVSNLGLSPTGVWAVTDQSGIGALLRTLSPDGSWDSVPVPMGWIDTVGEVDSVPVALGWSLDGQPAVARPDAAGVWAMETMTSEPHAVGAVAVPGGFFAWSGNTPETVVFSTDAVTWEEVDGRLSGGWGGTVPFLYDVGSSSIVRLVDRWPDVEEVQLPTDAPLAIQRSGESLWVQSPGTLWVRDGDGSWQSIPTGFEHGVGDGSVMVPGGEPTLAVLDDGQLRLLRLRP
jgi:hypothetical protein